MLQHWAQLLMQSCMNCCSRQ